MKGLFLMAGLLLSLCLPLQSLAKQNSGGGGGEDLKGVCELSGGEWHGSESSNWACCWPDWGCYGCVNGHCKMKCDTQRCKDANSTLNPGAGQIKLKQIAPGGMLAPIIPVKKGVKTNVTPNSTPATMD